MLDKPSCRAAEIRCVLRFVRSLRSCDTAWTDQPGPSLHGHNLRYPLRPAHVNRYEP